MYINSNPSIQINLHNLTDARARKVSAKEEEEIEEERTREFYLNTVIFWCRKVSFFLFTCHLQYIY